MTQHIPPAIVIGGGSANGLGIARNLGRRGIPIYCVTSNSYELTRYSKYCTGFTVIPAVERDPPRLLQWLHAFHNQRPGRSVLFPTTDTALLTVSQIREAAIPHVACLPSRDVVETMVMKHKFYASLRTWKVPHPRTVLPSKDGLPLLDAQMPFPVYLRPIQSLPFYQQFHRKGFVAHSLHEARRYIQMAQQRRIEVMVQEIIPGPPTNGYTVRGYVNQHVQPLVMFVSQKIRQPSMFSNNTVKLSIPMAHVGESIDVLMQYLQGIQYHGLFGAEWKRDPRDGVLKLLEINARSMGGNIFPSWCGANDVLTAYHDLLGDPVTPVTSYTSGIYGVNLVTDGRVLARKLLTGRLARADVIPYLHPHRWSRFSTDDLLPFFKFLQILIAHAHDWRQ